MVWQPGKWSRYFIRGAGQLSSQSAYPSKWVSGESGIQVIDRLQASTSQSAQIDRIGSRFKPIRNAAIQNAQ